MVMRLRKRISEREEGRDKHASSTHQIHYIYGVDNYAKRTKQSFDKKQETARDRTRSSCYSMYRKVYVHVCVTSQKRKRSVVDFA